MNTLRCFIAVELPIPLQDAVEKATKDLRQRLGADLVRWVPTRNIHLTLKFLGNTAAPGLGLVQASLESCARRFDPFEVLVRGFGAFPNRREPRVLWVGLVAPHMLGSLHREIDQATARLGYPSDGRAFSPHLTVGRTRQRLPKDGAVRIRGELEHVELGDIGQWKVEALHLFQSQLLASGSVYTRLFTAALHAG